MRISASVGHHHAHRRISRVTGDVIGSVQPANCAACAFMFVAMLSAMAHMLALLLQQQQHLL